MSRTLILVAVVAFVMSSSVSGQTHQAVKVIPVSGFDVIGIKCRTSNANEASGKGCIGEQWRKIMNEGIIQKIPGRADDSIVAVYTDYSSNKDGDYAYILGARVNPDATTPPGMVKTTVKSGRFAVFTSDKGQVQQVVPANWKRIWEVPTSEPGGDRLYESDFEIYDGRAVDPTNAQMDIFIRIR